MKTRPRLFFLTCCFLFFSILSHFIYHNQITGDIGGYLVLNGTIASTFYALVAYFDLRAHKSLSVIQIYCFGSFLRFGIGGVYAGLMINQNFDYMLNISDHLPIRYMPHAYLLLEIGTASFIFGALAVKFNEKNNDTDYFHFPSETSIFFMAVIGWSIRLLEILLEASFGVLGAALGTLPRASIFLYTLLAFFRTGRAKTYYVLIGTILFIEFWLARSSAMRETFAFLWLPIVLAYGIEFCRRWRMGDKRYGIRAGYRAFLPKKKKLVIYLSILIILIFNLLIIFPAGTLVKKNKEKNIDAAILKVIKISVQDFGAVHKFPDSGIYSLGHRLALIVVSPAIVLELMDQSIKVEHDPVQTILAGFIPRIIWEGKPIISKTGWFKEIISPFANRNDSTAMAMTSAAELYWAYGYLGVLVGMFVLGYYCNFFWNQFHFTQLRNPFIIIAAIHISQECLRAFEGEFSSPFSLLLVLGFLSYLFKKLLTPKSFKAVMKNNQR